MNKTIALIGNPNCGKTTLFNTLTNSRQTTGNRAGVTVTETIAQYKKDKKITIVDLPGIYSLDPKSIDEKVVLSRITNNRPDVIINVVDGTNLERNLFLTTMLIELKIPIVIAINMYDVLKNNGVIIDVERASEILGVPVVPISAKTGYNTEKLIEIAVNNKVVPKNKTIFANRTAENSYSRVEEIVKQITDLKVTSQEKVTLKIDAVLTHRIFSIPIFFLVITLIYFII